MNFSAVFFSGIIGTAVMTLFVYAVNASTGKSVKVVKILGTMLTFQTRPDGQLSERPLAIWVGIVAHYLIGVVFAWAFYACWQAGIGRPSLGFGALFGFLAGLAGILIWRLFFAVHPRPPQRIPLSFYLSTLVMAHVFFGVTVAFVYPWFNK